LTESVGLIPQMLLLQQTAQQWGRWAKQQEGEGEKRMKEKNEF